MSRAVSLSTLITRVRRRADIESAADRFSDAEITDNLNESITELYDVLLSAYGQDYYRAASPTTLIPTQSIYSLPSNFLSLISVDLYYGTPSNYVFSLRPFMESERNEYRWAAGLAISTPAYYRLRAANIELIPIPTSAMTLQINYVPTPTLLVNPGDTFDGINGWEEYAVLDAAIKCCIKDEATDVAASLEARKAVIAQRIKERATERDAGQPERIQDVTGMNVNWPWGDRSF